MSNTVKQVFSDHTKGSNILDASIENINLYKKTNKLEIELKTDKKIIELRCKLLYNRSSI